MQNDFERKKYMKQCIRYLEIVRTANNILKTLSDLEDETIINNFLGFSWPNELLINFVLKIALFEIKKQPMTRQWFSFAARRVFEEFSVSVKAGSLNYNAKTSETPQAPIWPSILILHGGANAGESSFRP